MPTKLALYVTVSIFLTVVACGEKPAYKRESGEMQSINGDYTNEAKKDTASKDTQAQNKISQNSKKETLAQKAAPAAQETEERFESLSSHSFRVDGERLFFEKMTEQNEIVSVHIGQLERTSNVSFDLYPVAGLKEHVQSFESQELTQEIEKYLSWFKEGQKIRVLKSKDKLVLTSTKGGIQTWFAIPAQEKQAKLQKLKANAGEIQNMKDQVFQITQGKKFILSSRVVTKVKKEKKNAQENKESQLSKLTADQLSQENRFRRRQQNKPTQKPEQKPIEDEIIEGAEGPVDVTKIPAITTGIRKQINIKSLTFKSIKEIYVNDSTPVKLDYYKAKPKFCQKSEQRQLCFFVKISIDTTVFDTPSDLSLEPLAWGAIEVAEGKIYIISQKNNLITVDTYSAESSSQKEKSPSEQQPGSGVKVTEITSPDQQSTINEGVQDKEKNKTASADQKSENERTVKIKEEKTLDNKEP